MTIVVTDISSNQGKAVSTLSITVPAGGVPAGALIVLLRTSSASMNAPTDTAGNTYALLVNNSFTTMHYVKNCLALAQNNTITVVPNTGTATYAMAAFYATGMDPTGPADQFNSATGTSTSPSVTTTGPTVLPSLIVGAVGVNGPLGDTFTQASGFTDTPPDRNGTTGSSATTNWTINGGVKIVSALGSQTYAPTLGTSRQWWALVGVFKGANLMGGMLC